jgi:glutamate 5-kinase
MTQREKITTSRRWVVKIGSALLTNDGLGLNYEGIADWVTQVAALKKAGIEVVLVSSGAVAAGMRRLGMNQRPHELHKLQAAAAVGQMSLIQAYESQFQKYDLHTAQILLTHDDLSDRKRYLNARSSLRTLLDFGIVPVINENDTVVTEEIRFGDNDTLGALAANLVEADLLVVLTDQTGLFDKNPREHADATLVREANVKDERLDDMVHSGVGSLGRGGMLTKLRAARAAARSGASTVIASGREPDVLNKIRLGKDIGTFLISDDAPVNARRQWLAGHLQLRGKLTLDDGAVSVLRSAGTSLLPVGVKDVHGNFRRGEVVACVDTAGHEVARGLINYNHDEVRRIMGQPSDRIESILGYIDEPELIHRDNLVLV